MSIRECRKEDFRNVLEIENASFSKPFSESLFKTFLAKFPRGFRIAESRGGLVGYSIIFPHQRDDTMVLISVAVDPDERRMKIGSTLLQDAITLAVDLGAKRMNLQVATENSAAKNLYSRFGFRKTRDLPDYYGIGKNALEMELLLVSRMI